LWVNRQCWKTTTPWIDGGIQEINGVVKVFVPPDSACYECAMTEIDYQLINLRYSCPLLRQEDLQAGKVPTAPTISSMIAGLQTQEALKLIHGLPVAAGQAFVYNGVANRFYATRFQRRSECLSHEVDLPWVDTRLCAESNTAEELFEALERQTGANGAPRLQLDRDLVVSIECAACNSSRRVMRPLQKVGMREARCDRCGQSARPRLEHVIRRGDPLARETLRSLGIAPFDVVRVESSGEPIAALLAGDRNSVLSCGPAAAER
jgi:adenylyltransferase/sulfurtransferase